MGTAGRSSARAMPQLKSIALSAAWVDATSAGTSIASSGLLDTYEATIRAVSSVRLVSTAIANFSEGHTDHSAQQTDQGKVCLPLNHLSLRTRRTRQRI